MWWWWYKYLVLILLTMNRYSSDYSGLCDLRPPIQTAKYGLKLKVVVKKRNVYTEHMEVVSLKSDAKMQGIVK